MEIVDVVLPTRSLTDTARFWREVLDRPVGEDGADLAVTVGSSRLRFTDSPGMEGSLHLAMTISTGSYESCRRWLRERVAFLARDGVDDFEAAPTWNARSTYFLGPDDSVLEVIERRELVHPFAPPFDSGDMVAVSEVGVVVDDAMAAVETIAGAGITPYGNPPGPGFAAVGTAGGMLILVGARRPWAPTTDMLSSSAPVTVTTADGLEIHAADGRLTVSHSSETATPAGSSRGGPSRGRGRRPGGGRGR